MATITFTIDDTVVPRIVAALSAYYSDAIGTATGANAIKAAITAWAAGIVANYEANNVAGDNAALVAQIAQLQANQQTKWQNQLAQTLSDMGKGIK